MNWIIEELVKTQLHNSMRQLPSLCLCYTTLYKDASLFIEKSNIELADLKPYIGPSSLLSYGKPYYRDPEIGDPENYPPITFLINCKNLNRYALDKICSIDSSLLKVFGVPEQFIIDRVCHNTPCLCVLPLMIEILFGDNTNFREEKIDLKRVDALSKEHLELQIIHNIYRKGTNKYGYLPVSIELRYTKNIPLNPFHVVLPEIVKENTFYNEEKFMKKYSTAVSYYGKSEYEDAEFQDLPFEESHKLMREAVDLVISKFNHPGYECESYNCITDNN